MSALLDKAKQQFNRGDYKIALATLRRLISQEKRNPDGYILAATIHEQQGNREQAAAFYADAIPLTPTLKREVGFRAASHFLAIGLGERALAALVALHRFLPDDADVNHGICSILREAGRYPEAAPFALKLAAIGTSFDNLLNAGIVLSGLGRYEEAYPALLKAHAENPDERLALSELFWCAGNLCDFAIADALQARIEQAYRREGPAADIRENAFRAVTWSADEAYHAAVARRTAAALFPPVAETAATPPSVAGRRIRIGYVSADFCEHATMALFAGVLESHDRTAFEIFGICHTPENARHGAMRARFLQSVDHCVDILALNDDAAAEKIRQSGIDILVDLKGFTQGSRLGIFCRRPAPVQVTYLGFPGSVAGVGIDYALTDAIVTPDSSIPHYQEKLLRLPASYQCNDAGREPVSRTGTRAEHGLPDAAMVFSSFNQAQKIRGPVFAAWMRILAGVDGSVLWIGDQLPAIRANLQKAAAAAGIDPARIVFAAKKPMAEHLRRLTQADIGLDTAPYNGHTTTSDALWCGVPVLTWKGTSFAGRVSESLLRAVGLPELVAADIDGFVHSAIALAHDRDRLSGLHDHLIAARRTAPLFDTMALTRAIEAHFRQLVLTPP